MELNVNVCAHCIEVIAGFPVRCAHCGYLIHSHCPYWLWLDKCRVLQSLADTLERS